MAKYRSGQTSAEVLDKKKKITDSLFKKAILITNINGIKDIYSALEIKNRKISLSAVLRWEDEQLGINKCSWNTAHELHNSDALKQILTSIDKANLRLINNSSNNSDTSLNRYSRLTQHEVNLLISENDELRNALAEVYRAYIQTLENIKEDKVVNEALRSLLKNQALILGKKRIWEVK